MEYRAHSFSFVFSLLNVDCSRVPDLADGRADIRVVMTSRMTIH
jgi:hypothetical protein